MDNNVSAPVDRAGASLVMRPTVAEAMRICGRYHAECVRDGKVIWEDDFDNLITDIGRKRMLDLYLDRGTAETAIHMGLKGAGTPVAADTMVTHASWTEIANTVVANRLVPAFTANSASGAGTVTKATNAAVSFPIVTATNVVIAGCFIVMSGTNSPANTTGTLYSVGDFTGGNKTVNSLDTLNVTYSSALT